MTFLCLLRALVETLPYVMDCIRGFPSNCDGNADMHKVGVLYHDGY